MRSPARMTMVIRRKAFMSLRGSWSTTIRSASLAWLYCAHYMVDAKRLCVDAG